MSTELLSVRYKEAADLVCRLFKDHKRIISGTPYVTHLFGVSHITQQLTDDEDVHIAALLHDVLEDISTDTYDAERMEKDFGATVRQIVETVSHDERNYSKVEARKQYLEQIRTGSREACLVSGADLLYNATDITLTYQTSPAELKVAMGGERATRRVWFWGERFAILSERLGSEHRLIQELSAVMDQLDRVHKDII